MAPHTPDRLPPLTSPEQSARMAQHFERLEDYRRSRRVVWAAFLIAAGLLIALLLGMFLADRVIAGAAHDAWAARSGCYECLAVVPGAGL